MSALRRGITLTATAALVAALGTGSAAALPSLSSSSLTGLLSSTAEVDAAENLPGTFDLQSHRFGRGEWTEESALGIAGSQALDVTTLEFDIVIAEDLTPLVWHDPTIQADKCTDTAPATEGDPEFPYVGDYVHELNWAQLQTLNCNLPLAGYPDAVHPEDNRLLQLSDVFELSSDDDQVHYNIETKREYDNPGKTATPQEFVDAILPVVEEYGVAERTMIQSFDWATLPLVREQAPEIPLVMLTSGPFDANAPYVGPVTAATYLEAARQLDVEVISPNYRDILLNGDRAVDVEQARGYIDEAHTAGLVVVPWTVNDAEHMQALIDAGVDGIITDYPTRLAGLLTELGVEF